MTKVINEIKIKVKAGIIDNVARYFISLFIAFFIGFSPVIFGFLSNSITENKRIGQLQAAIDDLIIERDSIQTELTAYIISNNLINKELSGKIDGIAQSVQLIIQLVSK